MIFSENCAIFTWPEREFEEAFEGRMAVFTGYQAVTEILARILHTVGKLSAVLSGRWFAKLVTGKIGILPWYGRIPNGNAEQSKRNAEQSKRNAEQSKRNDEQKKQ